MKPGIKVIDVGRRRSNATPVLVDPGQDALMRIQALYQRQAETDTYEQKRIPQPSHKTSESVGRKHSCNAGEPCSDLQRDRHNKQQRHNEFRGQEGEDRLPHNRCHVGIEIRILLLLSQAFKDFVSSVAIYWLGRFFNEYWSPDR
mmetsp:Transcript_21959/g.52270  ORF Transcript_21959/g.52270 Transcript_21959/m.52270 type:complete len:145 (-) Transcript_21959:25-459(-)